MENKEKIKKLDIAFLFVWLLMTLDLLYLGWGFKNSLYMAYALWYLFVFGFMLGGICYAQKWRKNERNICK